VTTDGFACQVCGAGPLLEVEGFAELPRVRSDCLPFRQGGSLCVCEGCSAAQKLPDERWFAEIAEIYRTYDIYHQSGGVEQSVFEAGTGQPTRRSAALAERVVGALPIKPEGRLLDFGCGTGATLAAFAAARPAWALFGLDLDDRYLARLLAIPGFAGLHTGPPQEAPGGFDLITMIHSLEHVPAPHTVLRSLREKLTPDGRLFVQVPDAAQNPFDLVVADHLCHFTADSLAQLVTQAGFAVDILATDWVKKEISLAAQPAERPGACRPLATPLQAGGQVRDRLRWLQAVAEGARRAADASPFGLFGTSVSATWLFGYLEDNVRFFLDEDPARAGGRHMHRPIWQPSQAPPGATVYLALIPGVAHSVRERLRGLPLHLHLPPALGAPA
jgi:SAM-dependent methyltransferase